MLRSGRSDCNTFITLVCVPQLQSNYCLCCRCYLTAPRLRICPCTREWWNGYNNSKKNALFLFLGFSGLNSLASLYTLLCSFRIIFFCFFLQTIFDSFLESHKTVLDLSANVRCKCIPSWSSCLSSSATSVEHFELLLGCIHHQSRSSRES